MADKKLRRKEIPLTGKLVTNEDPALIGTNFQTLKNMRQTRTNPKGIGGYTKINSTALSNPKIRSGIHFRKEQPAESHVLVESYDSNTANPEIYQNTTAIPGTGDFTSSIYTPTNGAGRGRWSLAPDGYVAYTNGEETCLWGGVESQVGGFINYDPAETFFKDQTDQISDTVSSGSGHVATLKRVTESTTDDVLLLHLENNDTDDGTGHTLDDSNVTYNSGAKKWGSYGAVFNGTDAVLTVPTHADFDFSGADATWTIDFWGTVDDLANNHYFYYKATDDDNYFACFITTGGAVQVSHFDTAEETLNSTAGFFTADGVISAGTQYHIEVVRNASSWYIFVDGQLKQNLTDTQDIDTESGDVLIGSNGTAYYDGNIDEYRVSTIARHTSNFELPIAAYGDRTVTYMYVGAIMPLEGIKFYVSTANATNATASVDYWSGSAWESVSSLSDGTSSGSKSLAQTGTMTFTSTATTAKVKSIKGVLLYWYRVSIPSMDDSVGVNYVTVQTPFQKIKDIWDGLSRRVTSFYQYTTAYNDYTGNVREDDYDSGNAATYVNLHGQTSSQYLLCGFTERQTGIRFNIVGGKGNDTANTVATVSYWDGSAWVSVGDITDDTSESNISFAQSGLITWNALGDGVEFQTEFTGAPKESASATGTTVQSPSLYYYKISLNQTLSGDGSNHLYLVNLTGIPAQKIISEYKFPLNAMNRLWLFSDQKGRKNLSICSSESTVNVFNGDDSIPLSWGDESEITGSAWLYSQYGASIYSILLVFKKSEMWALIGNNPEEWKQYRVSSSIGCVAPETIRVIELPEDQTKGVNRSSVVVFQGANGIYMSDGRPPVLVSKDIGDLFDKRESNITQSLVDDSFAFIDKENSEYHWCFGQGSSIDSEFVLDYSRMQWFEIDRTLDLQAGIEVEDTNGVTYTYGCSDTGYALRLEHGNSFDGTAITHTMQFGDIALHGEGSISVQTDAEYHLLVAKAKSTTDQNIAVTHYGDSSTTGTSLTMSPSKSGYRTIRTAEHKKLGAHLFHSWKFTISTDDETTGFEPLFFTCLYKEHGNYVRDYRS